MTHPAKWFFLAAAICVVLGMIWGIQMSATQDHSLAPAHAHLNLVGCVLLALFGTFYALSSSAAATRLCTIHLALHIAAVIVMVPGIVMAIRETGEAGAKIGSVLAVLSGVLFLYQVARHGIDIKRA